MKQKQGFTLVELLVVISIIGLLSTLAVVALNSARSKARDSRRLSDVKQLQTALELYNSDNGSYPTSAATQPPSGLELGSGAGSTLSSGAAPAGFAASASGTTYMGQVPQNFATPATAGYNYVSADGSTYSITFELEGAVSDLAAGSHTLTENGIQ